jgi:hypothetical protein
LHQESLFDAGINETKTSNYMITPKQSDDLRTHLQTAIEIELSTIPIYLYTYYSLNRVPTTVPDSPRGDEIATFANKAGGILMSVAVEEMLHLSLASNILKALGGTPKIYGMAPENYPTNLPDRISDGWEVGLTRFTEAQLKEFMDIENPAPAKKDPEGDNWETIGQFYEYIADLIKLTGHADYSNPDYQLADGKGYYATNNVDTVYPNNAFYIKNPEDPNDPSARGADVAVYPNSDDSGGLIQITCKDDALNAIAEISEQGEGYRKDPSHEFDDKKDLEKSHWYKYNELHDEFNKLALTPDELALFIFPFPDNPANSDYPADIQELVNLSNAVFSYLLWMTELSFTLKGSAQSSMFYIGMHKGMIFILDKIIGGMRSLTYTDSKGNTLNVAPTFNNFNFTSIETAKAELISLCTTVAAISSLDLNPNILSRIGDLPDVNVVNNIVSFA